MLAIRLVTHPADPTLPALALPVRLPDPSGSGSAGEAVATTAPGVLVRPAPGVLDALVAEAAALVPLVPQTGAAGTVHLAVRPDGPPHRLLLVGVGVGDEACWRSAGAALARSAGAALAKVSGPADPVLVALPPESADEAVRGLAEGLWLAAYRFRQPDRPERGDEPTGLAEVLLAVADPARHQSALDRARVVAEATYLARDLTNTPAAVKSPQWLADRVAAVAEPAGLAITVGEPDQLAAEGFGGILAVGGGSARGPRLVECAWRPPGAQTHVVLVGKGITFDTGGISIKPRDAMRLMRKDMGGAAAVLAATIGAAALRLPVRVTALAPLAENMVGGSAYRPGDVIRHYGGLTSESTNTDAEGRLVLADALAYAVDRLAPDLLIDLATLTGANAVALGTRTAALYSDNSELAEALAGAATAAGEAVWRMPLPADYVDYLGSDIADLYSAPDRGAGSVTAALYLREFTGDRRDRWAHLDMSAPSWSGGNDGELAKGATGWGVRTLLRWLEAL